RQPTWSSFRPESRRFFSDCSSIPQVAPPVRHAAGAFVLTLTAGSSPVIRGFPDRDTDFRELPANTCLGVLGARGSAAAAAARRGDSPKNRGPGGALGPGAGAALGPGVLPGGLTGA